MASKAFSKEGVQCGAKLSQTEEYSKGLFCLEEVHIVEKSHNGQHLSKLALKH